MLKPEVLEKHYSKEITKELAIKVNQLFKEIVFDKPITDIVLLLNLVKLSEGNERVPLTTPFDVYTGVCAHIGLPGRRRVIVDNEFVNTPIKESVKTTIRFYVSLLGDKLSCPDSTLDTVVEKLSAVPTDKPLMSYLLKRSKELLTKWDVNHA